jgi:mRNA-degrading endonuclease RelE of RelBE toxin-antitoxin system
VDRFQYSIRILDDELRRLEALPESLRIEAWRFIDEHLRRAPRERVRRRLKMLTGEEWRGYYQFDLDESHRLIYTIDETNNEVSVEYVGPHPDWTRSRPGAITP